MPTTEPSPVAKADTDAKQPRAAPSPRVAPDAERAAAAVDQALALYESGDLGGALELMRETYRLYQRPELLYNLARLERELKQCPASLANLTQ